MSIALKALESLREGNRRFVSGERIREVRVAPARRDEVADAQDPFAIILGCADSRVPAEIVFDQGLGDLFVIRVAGNIVAPSQIGSVEFAATHFGARLVVVLGHSRCGAVLATLDSLRRPANDASENLCSIVDRITPAVRPLLDTEVTNDEEELVRQAVRANVRAGVQALRSGSEILSRMMLYDGLMVVGAKYSLDTGIVDFLD